MKSFHWKPIFFVSYVKKTNFDAKKDFSWDFLFFTHTTKISVFRKTYYTHIEHQDVRTNFLFEIYWHAKIFFLVAWTYGPMCQSEFPINLEYSTFKYDMFSKEICYHTRLRLVGSNLVVDPPSLMPGRPSGLAGCTTHYINDFL